MSLPDEITEKLTSKYRIKFIKDEFKEHEYFTLLPEDLPPANAFKLRINSGWRNVSSEIQFGNFAAELLREMSNASAEQKMMFINYSNIALNHNFIIDFFINNEKQKTGDFNSWPVAGWHHFQLAVTKKNVNMNDYDEAFKSIWQASDYITGMILALIPIETAVYEEEKEIEGYPEGACVTVKVNKFERNHKNRTLCITFHGLICTVCEFNFKEFYGDPGSGFIHVHHITPVSSMGEEYIINPVTDLIPVCPNCHAMLHKKNPPYKVVELKKHLRTKEKVEKN